MFKYNVNRIAILTIKDAQQKKIVYLKENGEISSEIIANEFYQLTASVDGYRNKIVSQESFAQMLMKTGVFVNLLTSSGEMRESVTTSEIWSLMSKMNNFEKLPEEEHEKLYLISNAVAMLCVDKLRIYGDIAEDFNYLLKQFVFTEMQDNYMGKSTVVKDGKSIDYKVNRIIKYLGIDIDLEKLPNFYIEYDRDSVSINGTMILDRKFNDKTKKLK